jgi:hypothetical protein
MLHDIGFGAMNAPRFGNYAMRPVRIHWRLYKENGEWGTSVQPLKKPTAIGNKYSSAAYPYGAMNFIPASSSRISQLCQYDDQI